MFLSDEGPMLETLDYAIRIGSTPTFLYFDLYLYSAYAAHYVYYTKMSVWLFYTGAPGPTMIVAFSKQITSFPVRIESECNW